MNDMKVTQKEVLVGAAGMDPGRPITDFDVLEGRISCDKHDPGYPRFAKLMREGAELVVLLDGQQVQHLITADTGAGMVRAIPTDEHGEKVMVNKLRALVVVKFGVVRILVARKNRRIIT